MKMLSSYSSCAESDHVGCNVCFDCKWILNDDSQMPFSALVFDLLLVGDEIIRCVCNQPPTPTISR